MSKRIDSIGNPSGSADGTDLSPALTVLTLNIHMGRSMFNRRLVLEELRQAIRAVDADIVFLQEAVGVHPETTVASQYEFLGDEVWGDRAYGRNAVYSSGDHGNALLSKYPLVSWRNHDISVPPYEPRGLLHAVIAVPDHAAPVHAICTHLGLKTAERMRQLELLCALVSTSIPADEAVVVAGDFNDWRLQAEAPMTGAGMTEAFTQLHGRPPRSFPARLPLLRLDRVYLRGLIPQSARVLSSRPWSHLSDHAGLAVTLRR